MGDTVFNDADGNGVQGDLTLEPGLAGIVVFADINGNDRLDPGEPTDTTDSNGNYLLTGVRAVIPVTIIVQEGPTGFEPTTDLNGDTQPDEELTVSLEPGEERLTVDFGYQGLGVVGDTVFNDLNGNGIQDNNEPGIPNVTVTLTDSNGMDSTTATDDNGVYNFQNVPIGGTMVTITPPTGFTATGDRDGVADNTSTAPVGTTGDLNFDFGLAEPASLGDTVYFDTNGNGVQDAAEPGVEGVMITITGATLTAPVIAETDAVGNYSVDNLTAGDYTVTVTDGDNTPLADAFISAAPATSGNNDSNGSNVEVVTLLNGDNFPDADFGYVPPQGLSSTIYRDIDGDGTQGPNEPGIPGVDITVVDQNGNIVGTATTDANGNYNIPNLPTDVPLTVRVTPPAGLDPTEDPDGLDVTPNETTLTIAPGVPSVGEADFGYAPGSLGDTVYLDTNGNGVQDAGEAGVSGVTVTVSGGNLTAPRVVQTDTDGNYTVDNLDAGTYTVTISDGNTTPLAGNTISAAPANGGNNASNGSNVETVTLGDGVDFVDADFGYVPSQGLTSTIYRDIDGDGTQGPNEPGIPGVVVTVFDSNGNPIASVTTGPNGNYTIPNLPTDEPLTVRVTPPAGLEPNEDPDGQGVTPNETVITLTPGTASNGEADFGYQPGSIGDTIYNDTDGNGVQDNGELGIENVIVTVDGGSLTGPVTVQTDVNGVYTVGNLDAGTYTVTVTDGTGTPLENFGISGAPAGGGVNASNGSNVETVVLTNGDNFVDADFGYEPTRTGNAGPIEVAIAKQATTPVRTNVAGEFETSITLNVANQSAEAVNVTVDDNLVPVFPTPATFEVVAGSVLSNDLTVNANYDGSGDVRVASGQIAGNTIVQVTFTLRFTPNDSTQTTFLNQAVVRGVDPVDPTNTDEDLSDDGVDVSTGEDDPTPITPPLPTITGIVFDDQNSNGVNDSEPRVPGVTVTLFDSSGNQVGTPVLTDANGVYSFDNVAPGDYTVSFTTLPNNSALTTGNVGNDEAADSDVLDGTNATAPFTVTLAGALSGIADAGVVSVADPGAIGDLLISKVANKDAVSVGDTVRYTISVVNPSNAVTITQTVVQDDPPAGVLYIAGSARLVQGGVVSPLGATGNNPIDFDQIASIAPNERVQITYLMRIGAGVVGDELINTAQAFDPAGAPRSNQATAVVRLEQDPIFDKTTIIGKVFHDRDSDGWQDNADATGVAVMLGNPSLYQPGSTTIDFGNGPQRVTGDLSRGIQIGEITGRTSVADPFEFHRVTIRTEMNSAQLDNILVGTREGTRVQLTANDVRNEGHVGRVKRGMSGQDIRVTRIMSGNTMTLTVTNYGIHEEGLPGVRLATVGGLLIETDEFGRYHIADVDGGRMTAGRNFIVKVDPYTLPRGATFTTENPRVLRITRALLNKINFGVRIPVDEMKNEKIIEARLGEVFFDTDRDTIRPEYRPVIAKMARTIMKYRSGRLAIEGHADKRHNARYNLDLARRRAASVRAALEKLLPPGTFRNVEIFVDSPQEVIQNQMDTNEAHPEWRDSQTSAEPRALWNKALGAVLGLMVSTAHADEIVFTDPSMSEPFMTEVRESFNGGGTVFEDALLKAGARTGNPWELRLELRDGESSELIDAIPLSEGGDYSIDVNGGRVTLRQPMHQIVMERSNKVSDGKQVYLFADNDPLTVTLAYADIEDLQAGSNNDNVVGADVSGYDVEVISRGEGDPRANQLSTSGLQDNRRVDVRAKWRVTLPNGGAIWLTEDPLQLDPRLDVVATSQAQVEGGRLLAPVQFATYTNYGAFIDRWELLLFADNDDDLARPLAIVKGNTLKNGEPVTWRGSARAKLTDDGAMKYVLRVYDARGRYDETAPRILKFFNGQEVERDLPTAGDIYGLSNVARRIIPIHGSRIRMYGRDLSSDHTLSVNGDPVPTVDGRYVAEWLMPVGEHAFNLDLTDENGNSWPRQLVANVKGDAFFAVAIADVTIGENSVSGSNSSVRAADRFDEDTFTEGRFAFYLKAKRAAKYTITAQMDTREDELGDLFDDIHKKDPRSIARRLDADRYYGTYGDDSTTVSDVDTYGRVYARVEWDNSQALWGNYATGLTGTEFAEFNRSLYGAQLRYNSVDQTRLGDTRTQLTAFGAEQQTAQGYNRFLGTGGSLYYLSNQDVVQGSEKISVEVRSRDSDRILENITLERGLDYEIDEIQGRVILSRPLHQVARRTRPNLVKDQPLDGDQAFLVVDYEYVPDNGFNADKGTFGARGKHWIGDNIAVGASYATESRDNQDSELRGVDLVFKAAQGTYIKAEYTESEAQQALENQLSIDGGINFTGSQFARANANTGSIDGQAYSVEGRYNGLDYGSKDVQIAAWSRKRNDQFSTARYNDGIDTEEYGAELDWALTSSTRLSARYIDVDRATVSEERVAAVQLAADLSERLTVSAEVQNRDFDDKSIGNNDDDSTRGALGVSYDISRSWSIYGIGQGTFDGDTNDRLTVGVKTGVTDRLSLILEGSTGNRGEAIELGADYRLSDTQEVYGSYTLSTDRTDGDRDVATIGNRRQLTNQLNVFNEFQFSHGERNAGIGHVFGIDYDTEGGWTVGLSAQHSNLKDSTVNSGSNATIERSAATVTTRYNGEKTEVYTKLEFRSDTGAVDRDQWLGVVRLDRKVSDNFRWLTKYAYSFTETSGDADEARFAEFDLGFAYRPAKYDRWNILGKYTFLSDSGTFDGTTTANTQSGQFNVRDEERSHVLSLEGIYDISRKWEMGAKYAWKRQETRLPGVNSIQGSDEGDWAEAELNLAVVRFRYHMLHNWDGLAEYRILWTEDDLASTDSQKHGALLAIYRHLGSNFKVGVGYNFTDFSDDLTRADDYDASGWFINLIGKY